MQKITLLMNLIAISLCFDLFVMGWTKDLSHRSRKLAQHRERIGFTTLLQSSSHWVDGLMCREVAIDIKLVGPVSILEATASLQDELVDMALAIEEDEVPNQLQFGDPYGSVLWPAASSISNYLLTNCSQTNLNAQNTTLLEGLSILELGTGTGLVSLAASLGGASRIIATDYEQIPLKLLNYAQKKLNKGLTHIETGMNRCLSLRHNF